MSAVDRTLLTNSRFSPRGAACPDSFNKVSDAPERDAFISTDRGSTLSSSRRRRISRVSYVFELILSDIMLSINRA